MDGNSAMAVIGTHPEDFELKPLIYPLLALASLGFVATLVVHSAALLGSADLFRISLKYVGLGLFVVWFPTVFVMTGLTRDFKSKDLWRAALRGCPKWAQRTLWILFGYTWVGFFALPAIYGGGANSADNQARTMSAVLLAFYSIAVCVLYSATRVERLDKIRRCMNGHPVSPLAKYCEECGAPAITTR